MNITFAPKGILQIDDARITYKNFSGEGTKFNREGDRNFSLIIPDEELTNRLIKEGWNVKVREGRDEDEPPFMHLPVKVKFNGRGPYIKLISGSKQNELDEGTIACLDNIDIERIDLDIRPYDWNVNGKSGRTAYLHGMRVTQRISRFEDDEFQMGFQDNDPYEYE